MAKNTRHGGLAEGLKAWLDKPEGPIEPLQTNWTTVPANDNNPEEVVDFSFERNLLITPSTQEIMRQVKEGPEEKNASRQVVAIGRLRFSDGNQTERGFAHGPDDKVIKADFLMPVGAMLGTVEKAKQQAGGKGYTNSELEQSNLYFAHMLGAIEPRYVKRIGRTNGKSYTVEESRQMLAEATANTPVMPKVKRYGKGLPCGTRRMAECFVGMQKGKKGESGAIMWQDVSTSIVQREIWQETLASLAKQDAGTLDVALTARTMRDIGETHGFNGKRAERMGKRILKAANDNLQDALRKSAA